MGKERCPTRGGVLIVHTHCMDLQMQLQVANALLSAEQVSEAVKWATASALEARRVRTSCLTPTSRILASFARATCRSVSGAAPKEPCERDP